MRGNSHAQEGWFPAMKNSFTVVGDFAPRTPSSAQRQSAL